MCYCTYPSKKANVIPGEPGRGPITKRHSSRIRRYAGHPALAEGSKGRCLWISDLLFTFRLLAYTFSHPPVTGNLSLSIEARIARLAMFTPEGCKRHTRCSQDRFYGNRRQAAGSPFDLLALLSRVPHLLGLGRTIPQRTHNRCTDFCERRHQNES
jgi:hypothetical protein